MSRRRSSLRSLFCLATLAAALPGAALAAPRDVQIVDIDFATQVIELFNFGASTEPLDGWRFCSHDDSFIRRYTTAGGLNGVSIAPGASLFIHLNDDANGQPGHIDQPAGNFAEPLTAGAYGLQLYFAPVSFGNGNTIADHLQWSLGGIDDTTADERSDEAEAGGVWVDQSEWIATDVGATNVMLDAGSNGLVLHGPVDYRVPEPGFGVGLASAVVFGAATGRRARRRRP